MGIAYTHGQLNLLQEACKQERIVFSGLRIAELGNQMFRSPPLTHEVSGKCVFEALGATYTSFDRNGKDGAEKVDLAAPLPATWWGRFDLVTNWGCSEHVKDSQFQCWKNIHFLCNVRGWMLHQIPEVGAWPGHGDWHYTMERVLGLAVACNYGIKIARRFDYVESWGPKRPKHTLLLCFQRTEYRFPDEETFTGIMFPEGESWF